jgi:hypothetical protein
LLFIRLVDVVDIRRVDVVTLGDIWSENGISIFLTVIHYIDSDWLMQNRLGICKGLGDMAHTGEVTRKLTYDGLLKIGIGNPKEYEDLPLYIHMCTPYEGSNMLNAWKSIEGTGCVCHRQQTRLGNAM